MTYGYRRSFKQMKLNVAFSNEKIKELLMSLIRHHNGEEVDFNSLFTNSDSAREQIVKILSEYVSQNNKLEIDVDLNEAQINQIIEKEKTEFDEIKKMYSELVDIIKKYGNIEIYIETLQQEIRELEDLEAAKKDELDEILRKLAALRAKFEAYQRTLEQYPIEIQKLEAFLLEAENYITKKTEELIQTEKEYKKALSDKEEYQFQNKVD